MRAVTLRIGLLLRLLVASVAAEGSRLYGFRATAATLNLDV